MVLVGVVDGLGLFFLFSYVSCQLLLKPKELGEVLDHIDHDLGFVDGDILFLLFRHRLGRGGLWLGSKELGPESLSFACNADDFIDSGFDLHEA